MPIGEPVYGGTLRLLGPGGVDHLDTACAYSAASSQLLRALTRQLFAYPASSYLSTTRSFTPVADLATVVPTRENGGLSRDGRTYTIRLRRGVFWDTNPPREVTSYDVIRGLKRLANPVCGAGGIGYYTSTILGMREFRDAYHAAFAGRSLAPTAAALAEFQDVHDIAGVCAPDPRTVVFELVQPAGDFLNILAMTFATPAPAEYDAFLPGAVQPRSLGPYTVDHLDRRALRLRRNPAWSSAADPLRGGFVDAIECRRLDQPAELVHRRIERREADLAWSLPAVSWARTVDGQDVSAPSFAGYALNPYLVFNLRSPNAGGALRDVRVRRAVGYAVDKVAVGAIMSVLDAPNRPMRGVIPPGSAGYRDYDPYPTPDDWGDPDTARDLLAEAGHGDGFALVAAVRDGEPHGEVMASIAADLAKVGIHLTVEVHREAEFYGALLCDPDRGRAGAWDIAAPSWVPDWFGSNGRAVVQPLFATNDQAGTANYGGYANPLVDRLIDEALREPDPERADELWHRIDRQVMADVAIVPILATAATISRRHPRHVRNVVYLPQTASVDLTNVWLDRDG